MRATAILIACALGAGRAAAAPPTPSGQHPRLFLGGSNLATAQANAGTDGTASKAMVDLCQETIDSPQFFTGRGGADGDTWPAAAVACAFAYQVTQNAAYATQAIVYWTASLNDDQDLGDGLGCVPGVSTDWRSWNGNPPAPPIIITVTHDTGYPMRWFAPYIALTYDWLHDAPGVDDALRAQTRMCLTAWVDYYTDRGYHNDEAGANYNAGYVIGKTLAAVAMGTDNGADGDRMWTETVDGVFADLLIGQGLAGRGAALGAPAGVLVGGDWGEGWQYGPLSVLEYAAAARVVEENGQPLPEMDEWTNSLIVRYIHATVPGLDGQFVGGDFDSDRVYQSPTMNVLDAVRLGPSSDQAAAWAASMRDLQMPGRSTFIWNALAEIRSVAAEDYRAQSPAPPLWYIARGTRNVYARTAWDANAFWAVFSSPPQVVSDHHHHAAGNFVFSRGGDHLVVDPSNYGEPGTLETNAVTADSPGVAGDYAPSQTPWSEAELVWARGTDAAVYAARGDFAKAFRFTDNPSDIPYARREWVFLPEGEIVTIDRVHTADASHFMYLNFHTNTGGTLALSGPVAVGTVGASKVAIQGVRTSGAAPVIFQPAVTNTYEYPCGACTNARFAVDDYSLKVPGPWAVAIHVIDGLGGAELPAQVGSLNDDDYDPPPKQNDGIIGAAVYRASKQSFIVASSGVDGQVGATMNYGVPGGSASRHVVFDAPEDGNGRSLVSASAGSGRCLLSITAGDGFAGRPLMFSVATAQDGCTVSEDTNVAPGNPPPGGGVVGLDAGPGGPGVGPRDVVGGCSLAPSGSPAAIAPLLGLWWWLFARRRRWAVALGALLGCGTGSIVGPGGGDGGPSGNRPVIASFVAAPDTLPAGGGQVTLSWSVTGAATLVVDPGIGPVTGTSIQTNVTATTVFTLSASNADGTTTRSALVTVGAAPNVPAILSFTATPATLPAGGGQTQLAWQVQNATSLSIDHGIGAVTGDSTTTSVAATTVYTLTATNAEGSSTSTTAVVVGQNPSTHGGREVAMVAPTDGESFVAPTTLRLVASGRDHVDTNYPTQGHGGNASKVQFFVDDAIVLEVDGANAEYWIFKGFANGVTAGQHLVWARAIYVDPAEVLDSRPSIVTVNDPPAYDRTVDLTADVVLSGSTGYELIGAAGARIRLNGNGHRITSTGGASGPLTLEFVDAFDLGDRANTGEAAIDVTTGGAVTIEDSIFDTSNALRISASGSAAMSIRRNLLRSNMRMPIGQDPDAPSSHAVAELGGSGGGPKVFAGNNVGASYVTFSGPAWVVGGDTDADSNVLIGPRVGIYAGGTVQIRRNYSHHVYYGGWSQGSNFELGGGGGVVAEHNVIYGSSWPVRGVAGEFRYNLVLDAGHQWLWADNDDGSIHHNLFVGGEADVGGIYVLYAPQNVRFFNNTIDGQGNIGLAIKMQDGMVSFASNVLYRIPAPGVSMDGGSLTADYNLFYNPSSSYSDGRTPAHDVTGVDPMFADPIADVPFDLDEVGVWKRTTTVRDILARYRMRYTPGSPAIDVGDPAGGSGNDIGAIGAGEVNAADRFGQL